MAMRYYMVSMQEPAASRNSHINGTNNAPGSSYGYYDDAAKHAKRQAQSAVVLFSEFGKLSGVAPRIEAYQLRVGKKTEFDHRDGIQVLSPRALQLVLMRLEEDKTADAAVKLFLDPTTRDIFVRHTGCPVSVQKIEDNKASLKDLCKDNVVNRIEGHGFGKADNSGRLTSAFGTSGQPVNVPDTAQSGYQAQQQIGFDF